MMSYSVKVALNLPIYHTFDYILPESTNRAIPGIRVEVPFGQKKMTGIIVSADNQPFDASAKTKYKLKKIIARKLSVDSLPRSLKKFCVKEYPRVSGSRTVPPA